MYKLLLLTALVAVAVAASTGKDGADNFIINGADVETPGQYPWQCALDFQGRHNCGCAVIGASWVVTAAHCLWNNSTMGLRILVGAHDRYSLIHGRPSFHYVTHYFIHPDFEMNSAKGFPNDIGLVKLSVPIDMTNPYVKAIKMYDGSESFAGYTCAITGWGYDDEDKMPDVLQYANVDVYSNDWCRGKYPSIFEGHVCVGKAGYQGSCNGDSGGPLSCKYNNQDVLVGLTSFGRWGCDTNYPSVYARMSTYVSWVREITGLTL